MRIALVIALIAVLFFSIGLAQNDTSGQQQQQQTQDLCANVRCESPPSAFCRGNEYVKYSSPGTCSPSSGQCSYSESATSCGETSRTCPDGFVAKCQNICDSSGCKPCEASCAGHETAPQQTTTTTTTTTTQNQTVPAQPACPSQAIPQCAEGSFLKTNYKDGCPYYECVRSEQACAQVITLGADAAGNCKEFSNSCLPPGWNKVDRCGAASVCGNGVCEFREDAVNCPSDCKGQAVCGNKICEEGEADVPGGCGPGADPRCLGPPSYAGTCPSDCQKAECPVHPTPVCEKGFATQGGYDEKGCRGPATCCGDSVCSGGENAQNCRQDCVGSEPDKVQCPDGKFVECKIDPKGFRYCEPCRISEKEIPEGCHQEVEKETGFVRVVCENVKPVCQEISIPQDAKEHCEEKGGRFEVRKDFNGCEFPDCSFGDVSVRPLPSLNPLEGRKECRVETEEQREATRQNCEKLGLSFVIAVHGGCQVSKCSTKPRDYCEFSLQNRREVETECREKQLAIVKDFDSKGCPVWRCGEQFECARDPPKDSYEKCSEHGGELVVKRNERGCVAFAECIEPGNTRAAFAEPIEHIPEATELLAMAFRMEELRIELDKLARKTEDIANYYESTNSPDEGRYRRVSDMFEAAKDKVDEIKGKLRAAVERGDVKENDLLEVKRDIRYIKDVMMKDILYLMLSSSEDVKDIKESRAVKRNGRFEEVPATDDTNCGSDGECFNRGFRLCKKLIFYPEGRSGPKVEVRGLDGDACIMYAVMPEGEGPPAGAIPGINPPYDMTCKIKNYALGVDNPEEDVFPYCEGPMVELMKKFGPRGENAPGVPGKCSGEECRNYCGRGAEEAKECLEHLGPYLPPEAKQGLEALASGKTPGGFERRGEFRGEFERREEFRGGEFERREEFRSEFEGGEFRSEFREGEFREEFRTTAAPTGRGEQCSGCLNNNICDPGECSFCPDCSRTGTRA